MLRTFRDRKLTAKVLPQSVMLPVAVLTKAMLVAAALVWKSGRKRNDQSLRLCLKIEPKRIGDR